jgi:hypothetical protein
VSLASQAAVLATRRRQAAHLAVLVRRVADPVNTRIISHALMHRVNHDNLIVLVHRVLVEPVRVQHAKGAASSRRAFFSHRSQVARKFELGNTAVYWLTVYDTLAHRTLTSTTSHTGAVNAKPLLRLVPQSTRLVRSRRSRHPANGWQLTVLPHPNAL